MTIQTVKIWLKSFIPRDSVGAVTIEQGIHAGKTALPTPPPILKCYLTDNRDFSDHIDAEARMHSEVEIDLENPRIMGEVQKCYPTTEVDCTSGEVTCKETAPTDAMKFSVLDVSEDKHTLSLDLEGSAHNACLKVASVRVSPMLDYHGTITIVIGEGRRSATVKFEGMVETYPAFEMYVAVNGGAPQPIFQLPIEDGAGPAALMGGPRREVTAQLEVSG